MNNIFSFSRFKKLLYADYIENRRSTAVWLIVITFLIGFYLFCKIALLSESLQINYMNEISVLSFMLFYTFFISTTLTSANSYTKREILNQRMYLPATVFEKYFEKWFTTLFATTIFYLIVIFSIGFIAKIILLMTTDISLTVFDTNNFTFSHLSRTIIGILSIHSMTIFAAICFHKRKSLGLIITAIATFLFYLTVMSIIYHKYIIELWKAIIHREEFVIKDINNYELVSDIITLLTIVILWVAGYFLIKRRQIK